MATNPSSTVVGVFTDRSMAEQAMRALHDAGISNEQIHYSGTDSSGGLLENLKSLFTGSPSSGDFSGLGLSDEETRYYSNEYNKGNSVIAVQAPGHEEDVLSVLNRYSASSYHNDPAVATSAAAVSGNVAQSAAGTDATNYAGPHSLTATETPPAQYAIDSTSADPYSTSHSDQNVADTDFASPTDQNVANPPPTDSYSTPETPTNGYINTATPTDNSTSTETPVEEGAADEYQHAATAPDSGYADAAGAIPAPSAGDYEQAPLVDASAAKSPVTTANDVIAAPESDTVAASSGATNSDTTLVDGSDAVPAAEGEAIPVAEGEALPIVADDALPIAESPAAMAFSDDTMPVVQDDTVAPSTSDAVAMPTSEAFVNNDMTPVSGSEVVSASNGAQAASTDGQDYDDVIAHQQTDKLIGKNERGVQSDQDVPPLEGQQENDPDVYEARVRDAQSRLQDHQQQLRDARARLQAAKQREAQLQASHQRYQEVQTQLQGVQSELEATLAELKETQSRIDQYR